MWNDVYIENTFIDVCISACDKLNINIPDIDNCVNVVK